MMRISACVIARNEERNIACCLASVRNIADELIVVDTGSCDETQLVARQAGAEVIAYDWQGDFAAARNFALDRASGDWILFLDADEYIAPACVANVRALVMKLDTVRDIDAICCRLDNLEAVGGRLRSSNPIVRIFRHSQAVRYRGRIHECLEVGGRPPVVYEATATELVICHTGYAAAGLAGKFRRNLVLLIQEETAGRATPLTYYYISDAYWHLREYRQAADYAQQALGQAELAAAGVPEAPYIIILDSLSQLPGAWQLDSLARKAAGLFAGYPEVQLFVALYYYRQGAWQQALDSFAAALAADEAVKQSSGLPQGCRKLVPKACVLANLKLAELLVRKNEPAAALGYYVQVLHSDRYEQAALEGLLAIIGGQPPEEMIYFLNSIYDKNNEADLEFLVMQLARLKPAKVFAYYHDLWCHMCGQDDFYGLVLLAEGRYGEVYKFFAAAFRENASYAAELTAVTALLLGGEEGWLELLGPGINSSLRRIATSFFCLSGQDELVSQDFPLFCDVVKQLVLLGDDRCVEKLLAALHRFSADNVCTIAVILQQRQRFRLARGLYLLLAERGDAAEPGYLYEQAGYCSWRQHELEAVIRDLTAALKTGWRSASMQAVIGWAQAAARNGCQHDKLVYLQNISEKS